MKYSFNLIDRPWIPGATPGGSTVLLSLRDTLARAHELSALSHESPLVRVSLIRLLLAVLHRSLGPREATDWVELWKASAFDMASIDPYLERWHARFDLFDSERPFYQDSSCPGDKAVPVSKLRHECASGNNATLFNHCVDELLVPVSAAEAALQLIAHQAFALTGTATPDDAIAGSQYTENAPNVKAAVCVCRGENLHRTLLLNLRRYDPSQAVPFGGAADAPAWERADRIRVQPRVPEGWLDLLTWQSRRLLLCPEGDPEAPVIRTAVVMKGETLAKQFAPQGKDSMFAWRRLQNPLKGSSPWVPVGFRQDRSVWRDAHCLFGNFESSRRPPIMDWISEVSAGVPGETRRYVLDLAGLCTDRAKVLSWHSESLPLPVTLLQQPLLWAQVRQALEAAEQGEGALRFSVRRMAECLLVPQDSVGGEKKAPDKRATERLCASLQRLHNYWAELQLAFRSFILDLGAGGPQSVADESGSTPALSAWIGQCRGAAQRTMDRVYRGAGQGMRTYRAVAESESALLGKLNRELPEPKSIQEAVADVAAIAH